MSGIHHFAVRLEHADLAPVLHHLESDAVALLGLWVEQGHVGDIDGHVLVDDATGLVLRGIGALVLLDAVDALDDQMPRVDNAQNGPALSLVLACGDDHIVAFSDFFHARVRGQSTSGASETIFMKRSFRNSRVTGPKIRVPMGSILGVSSTAALPSKRMRLPSARRTPCAVRTTTAW